MQQQQPQGKLELAQLSLDMVETYWESESVHSPPTLCNPYGSHHNGYFEGRSDKGGLSTIAATSPRPSAPIHASAPHGILTQIPRIVGAAGFEQNNPLFYCMFS